MTRGNSMQSAARPKVVKSVSSGPHKKATYTLPPDALDAVDENWRFHETLDARFADSKSEYVTDLIRRDAAQKHPRNSKTHR